MIKVRTNLSDVSREITKTGKAVFKDIDRAIADGIWKEFEQLVKETAQYTGTTAASWNLSMQYRVGAFQGISDYRQQKERTRSDALAMGHMHAVNVALNANQGALDKLSSQYGRMDINVSNNAPGAEQAEQGAPKTPRSENTGAAHALTRFEARVAVKVFKIDNRIIG